MKRVYDLDGTLSSLNSTFDFIFPYLKDHRPVRYLFSVMCWRMLRNLTFIAFVKRRRWIVKLLFHGIGNRSFRTYYDRAYRERFFGSLTDLRKEVCASRSKGLILTGCVEFPARWITQNIGCDIICTTFRYDRCIRDIGRDTYGDLKILFLPKDSMRYFTDDMASEPVLAKKVKELVIVG